MIEYIITSLIFLGGASFLGRGKYSAELKMEVVQAVLEEKRTIDDVSREYVLHKSTVNKWVSLYQQNGTEGIERKYNTYTSEFKLQVVEDMRTNQLSYRATAIKYNIGIHTSIKQWERTYLKEGYEGLRKKRGAARVSHAQAARRFCVRRQMKI